MQRVMEKLEAKIGGTGGPRGGPTPPFGGSTPTGGTRGAPPPSTSPGDMGLD